MPLFSTSQYIFLQRLPLIYRRRDSDTVYLQLLPVNFTVFLEQILLQNTSGWLLLFSKLTKIPQEYNIDTERILNIHKTFRRCPGGLRNVFSTFNIRP